MTLAPRFDTDLDGPFGEVRVFLCHRGEVSIDASIVNGRIAPAQVKLHVSPAGIDDLVAWWAEHRDEARERAGLDPDGYRWQRHAFRPCSRCGKPSLTPVWISERDGATPFCSKACRDAATTCEVCSAPSRITIYPGKGVTRYFCSDAHRSRASAAGG